MPAAALMKKAWLFKPNEYTTSFTLTATFADGQAVFEYTKTEGSWVPKGTHSPRLVISPASESNDWCFVVRVFENDVFDAIRATYANARTSTNGVRVGMKRLVFDKDFYSTHLFEPNCDYDNPYDLFNNSDLGDICFTNLTKNITLPNKKENYGHWYGWGAYNQTKPYSKLNKINDYDNLYRMPLSWIYSTQLEGFPTININDSTSEHPNISKLCEAPMVDDVIYMVPLYHNETPYYDIDTKDYGEPVYPIEPEPPIPDVDPNQKVFINAVSDYDGNWYDAVIIGDQVLTASNLRMTHYADGTEIINGNMNISNITPYYYYPGGNQTNVCDYGLLYNYKVIESANNNCFIQAGWSVPSFDDVSILKTYIGSLPENINTDGSQNSIEHPEFYIAKSMCSKELWENSTMLGSPGYNAQTNDNTYFGLVPAGSLTSEADATPAYLGTLTRLWTSTVGSRPWSILIDNSSAQVPFYMFSSSLACSVRCISNKTPQEFIAWYYNEYGSYSHELDA